MTASSLEIINNNEDTPKSSKKRLISKMIRDILAVVIWLYIIIKVFVFDFDIFLINKYLHEYAWLLNLKFFIIIGILAITWIFTKNKNILIWSLYIFFFPFIVVFWKIPYLAFKKKNELIMVAFINSIISFFVSVRYCFITSALYLISIAIMFNSTNEVLLFSASIIVFILLIATYFNRFLLVFKKSNSFNVYTKILNSFRVGNFTNLVDDEIMNLPIEELSEKQFDKWTTNLQTVVIFNRLCLFVGKKLRNYSKSGISYAYYIIVIVLLFVLTVFTFAMINYSLYRIDVSYFSFNSTPNFFTFFYLSFNNIGANSIIEISPILSLSKIVYMIECACAFFLGAIFITLMFSAKSQKHFNEMDEVIAAAEKRGQDLESLIIDKYKINSIDEAISELERTKAVFMKLIYILTESQ